MAKEKTIEQRYTKMTQLEHVLARPDSYVGSCNMESITAWVWDNDEPGMVQKTISYVPAMFKIFDEIIVNAADVKARELFESTGKRLSQRMTKLEIDITKDRIRVSNDGPGIPVEIHKDYDIYVPELIFGQLLTSDNYNDNEVRYTGGRNGYGAKLTNIFSSRFEVNVVDSQRKRKFNMVWKKNMEEKSEPAITVTSAKTDSVEIIFHPDFKRLNMPEKIDDSMLSLLQKRVYDMAGTVGVKVYLNGEQIRVSNFRNYVDLYFEKQIAAARGKPESGETISSGLTEDTTTSSVNPESNGITKIYEQINDHWEIVIGLSEGQFSQVSFVNNICTSKGGTHVNYIVDPIVQAVLKKVTSKNKGGMEIKSHHVKNHMFVFLNCRIVNPTFDSQTKEYMTLSMSFLRPPVSVSDKTINAVVKSQITENVLIWLQTKQQVELKRLMKSGSKNGARDRIVGIPKLEDANDAGTRNGHHCTLILTEGDSAKTSCIAGLSVVGRDRYGVFPLRGKVLNVRDASFKSLSENKEIQNILRITGLEIGKRIEDPRNLRYGSIMIMTDQDHDGSHIKGLIINLLQHFWPDLLKYPGFLKEFVTPILKATSRNETKSFFTIQQFENWKDSLRDGVINKYKIKYYKGLGTSGAKEFQEYFANMHDHQLQFKFENEEDYEHIDMAFNSKRAEDRKAWIQSFEEGTYLDHSIKQVRYKDFINKELVLFSRYDVERSIPSLIDGLKPAQRKVIFGAFKKGLIKNEMKVAQFASYVADVSSYHHGEESIAQTIVNMAQQFVGSNNLNLLEPCGQFGSRKEGGKDASATRYIYTRLSAVCRMMFRQEDEPILKYNIDEGTSVEPIYYVPVIPNVLVNGCEGIGTGWSSSVPNFNPRDIIENIRRYLDGRSMEPMKPWYRGFQGIIEPNIKGGYDSVGTIDIIDDSTLYISELPIRVWTQPYKEYIEELLQAGIDASKPAPIAAAKATAKAKAKSRAKVPAVSNVVKSNRFSITDYRDNSTHETISFTLSVSSEQLSNFLTAGLDKSFKLRKSISMTNMTAFGGDRKVRRYETELDMMKEFCGIRLQYYEMRKAYILKLLRNQMCFLSNKLRFVLLVVDGSLILNNQKKQTLIAQLQELGFETSQSIDAKFNTKNPTILDSEGLIADPTVEEIETENDSKNGYDYLLSMPLYSLTYERVEDLRKNEANKKDELQRVTALSPSDMWNRDLDDLEKAVIDFEAALEAQHAEADRVRRAVGGSRTGGRPMKTPRLPARGGTPASKKSVLSTLTPRAKDVVADDDVDTIFTRLQTQAPRNRKRTAAPNPPRIKRSKIVDSDDDIDVDGDSDSIVIDDGEEDSSDLSFESD